MKITDEINIGKSSIDGYMTEERKIRIFFNGNDILVECADYTELHELVAKLDGVI